MSIELLVDRVRAIADRARARVVPRLRGSGPPVELSPDDQPIAVLGLGLAPPCGWCGGDGIVFSFEIDVEVLCGECEGTGEHRLMLDPERGPTFQAIHPEGAER